jgi:iron-sulfur cluster repair protein YtfE (RIC family)
MRMTALTVIHKYLRAHMFDVSRVVSSAGPADVPEVQRVIEEIAELLEEHANREEEMFGPMLAATPTAVTTVQKLHDDHVALDAQLADVRARAKSLHRDDPGCEDDLLRLHLDWNRVLGLYLGHLDEEERTLFTSIEEQLPDPSFLGKQVAHFEPKAAEAFVKTLWQITTPRERNAIERALPPR